jgi:hypothetical protein
MAIVRWFLLALIGLALVAIWAASAGANFAHGLQIAGYSPYWLVFGLASASADVLKAWVLISGRSAWQQGRRGALLACALVWVLTTAWGVRSCWGFIATTLSDTVSSRTIQGVADTSLVKQIGDQVDRIIKLQDHKLKAPSRDWDRIEDEIKRTERRAEELRKQVRTTQAVGSADASGDLLVAWLGGSEKQVQIGTALLFMLLIEVCASLGFIAFAPMFTKKQIDEATEVVPEVEVPEPAPKLKLKPKKKKPSPLREQAMGLLEHLESKYGEGHTISVTKTFSIYKRLAEERGWDAMVPRKLGQQLKELDVDKAEDEVTGEVYYVLPTSRQKAERKTPSRARLGA